MLTRRHLLANGARIAGAASLAALVPGGSLFAGTGGDTRYSEVVTTRAGKVRGLIVHGTHAFKGIPYGGSTSGAHRFLAPQPAQPWTGVRDAFEWGTYAPQSNRKRGPKQSE